VSWDSDALRTPATAYAQTLAASVSDWFDGRQMTSKKTLFIGLILGTGLFFGLFAYFVGGITATVDPIKSYRYSLTRDELKQRLIETIKANPNLTFKLTDSTGTDRNDLHYHADIFVKVETERYEFHIKFNKENTFWDNNVKSEISLGAAFDFGYKTGGYVKEAPGVDRLIEIFEREIIKKLGENTSR